MKLRTSGAHHLALRLDAGNRAKVGTRLKCVRTLLMPRSEVTWRRLPCSDNADPKGSSNLLSTSLVLDETILALSAQGPHSVSAKVP